MFEIFKKKETDEEIFDRVLTQKMKALSNSYRGGLNRAEFDSSDRLNDMSNCNNEIKNKIVNYLSKATKTILQDLYCNSDNINYDLCYAIQDKQEWYLKNL